MAQRIMSAVDVKLGIKSILSRVEGAYAKRNPVTSHHREHIVQSDFYIFVLSFAGDQNI